MRISVSIFVILILVCIVNTSLLDPVVENVVHINASLSEHGSPGTWKKKTIWKPRWVKEWKSAKVMKPTWKKVWSPVLIQEWIPFPKPPAKWKNKSTPLIQQAETKLPLWDPMPYPESQQPPPAPAKTATYLNERRCHHEGCSGSPPSTFTHDQIAQIISHNRYKKATDNSKISSSHTIELSELPTNLQSWRLRRQSPFGFLSPFNLLPELSQFLVPPKFQALRNTDLAHHPKPKKPAPALVQHPTANNKQMRPPIRNLPPTHSNGHQHPPQPPNTVKTSNSNKPLNHFYKYQVPNSPVKTTVAPSIEKQKFNAAVKMRTADQQGGNNQNPQSNSNFIQPAELVGEYHYVTEYDFNTGVKPEQSFENVEFKPLPPSLWSIPTVTKTDEYAVPKEHDDKRKVQLQSDYKGKLRPIRKDADSSSVSHLVQPVDLQRWMPSQSAKNTSQQFDQEKAIAKEIFPANHRFELFPVTQKLPESSTVSSETTPVTVVRNDSKNETTLEQDESQSTDHPTKSDKNVLSPFRLSEEALLNAIQNNRTNEMSTSDQSTSSTYFSATSSSGMSSTTKSPVFIVTPIYLGKSN